MHVEVLLGGISSERQRLFLSATRFSRRWLLVMVPYSMTIDCCVAVSFASLHSCLRTCVHVCECVRVSPIDQWHNISVCVCVRAPLMAANDELQKYIDRIVPFMRDNACASVCVRSCSAFRSLILANDFYTKSQLRTEKNSISRCWHGVLRLRTSFSDLFCWRLRAHAFLSSRKIIVQRPLLTASRTRFEWNCAKFVCELWIGIKWETERKTLK